MVNGVHRGFEHRAVDHSHRVDDLVEDRAEGVVVPLDPAHLMVSIVRNKTKNNSGTFHVLGEDCAKASVLVKNDFKRVAKYSEPHPTKSFQNVWWLPGIQDADRVQEGSVADDAQQDVSVACKVLAIEDVHQQPLSKLTKESMRCFRGSMSGSRLRAVASAELQMFYCQKC